MSNDQLINRLRAAAIRTDDPDTRRLMTAALDRISELDREIKSALEVAKDVSRQLERLQNSVFLPRLN